MQMSGVRLLSAFLGALLLSSGAAASTHPPESGCAAFSQAGDLAEISIRSRELTLRLFRPASDSQPRVAVLKLGEEEWGCNLAFSSDDDLLAVATWTQAQQMRVRLWELDTSKWVALDPHPPTGYAHNVELLGFWMKTHDLVFSGTNGKAASPRMAIYTQSPSGKLVENVESPPAWVDLHGGFLWEQSPSGRSLSRSGLFSSARQDTHESVVLPTIQGASCWADGIVFPTPNFLVGASASGTGVVTVWASRPGAAKPDLTTIVAPQKKPLVKWSDVHVRIASAPQGNLFAVDRQVTEWGLMDTIKARRDDIWIYSAEPLKLIAHVPPQGCGTLDAFALGSDRLAGEWCGKWQIEAVVPERNHGVGHP